MTKELYGKVKAVIDEVEAIRERDEFAYQPWYSNGKIHWNTYEEGDTYLKKTMYVNVSPDVQSWFEDHDYESWEYFLECPWVFIDYE